MDDNELNPAHAPIAGAGPRLKAARDAAGLSVAQISAQTKIPVRMLELIESGNFARLPGRTYATGFTRTYARALGLDENEYVAAVRQELGLGVPAELHHPPAFEPGDPARIPTARFALLAFLAALMVVAAGLFFWRTYYAPAVILPSVLPPATAGSMPAALPTAPGLHAGIAAPLSDVAAARTRTATVAGPPVVNPLMTVAPPRPAAPAVRPASSGVVRAA